MATTMNAAQKMAQMLQQRQAAGGIRAMDSYNPNTSTASVPMRIPANAMPFNPNLAVPISNMDYRPAPSALPQGMPSFSPNNNPVNTPNTGGLTYFDGVRPVIGSTTPNAGGVNYFNGVRPVIGSTTGPTAPFNAPMPVLKPQSEFMPAMQGVRPPAAQAQPSYAAPRANPFGFMSPQKPMTPAMNRPNPMMNTFGQQAKPASPFGMPTQNTGFNPMMGKKVY